MLTHAWHLSRLLAVLAIPKRAHAHCSSEPQPTPAVGITAVFYSIVGLFGYMAFPTTAKSNILNSFGATDHIMQVSFCALGFQYD